jgi:hypothetical protein
LRHIRIDFASVKKQLKHTSSRAGKGGGPVFFACFSVYYIMSAFDAFFQIKQEKEGLTTMHFAKRIFLMVGASALVVSINSYSAIYGDKVGIPAVRVPCFCLMKFLAGLVLQ